MSWRTVEVEVVFFDVFAMIAFTIRQPKQSLLEYWISSIPERYGEA